MHIPCLKRPVHDDSGQAESCRLNFLPDRASIGSRSSGEEISDQILESRIVSGLNPSLEDGTKRGSVFCEQSKATFCPADIACQNHRRALRLLTQFLRNCDAWRTSAPNVRTAPILPEIKKPTARDTVRSRWRKVGFSDWGGTESNL
jgi:hypothetical protein